MNGDDVYYLQSNRLTSAISIRVRRKIFREFMRRMNPNESNTVLDIGVTSDEKRPESNFFESWYPWKNRITCVGLEDASHLERRGQGIRFERIRREDRFPFEDKSFDFAFSNAVIEHVGSLEDQRKFVGEMDRVAKRIFIATPDRWCPMEFHTGLLWLHFMPKRWHRSVLKFLGHGFWCEESHLNLLSRGDLRRILGSRFYYGKPKTSKIHFCGIGTNLIGWTL